MFRAASIGAIVLALMAIMVSIPSSFAMKNQSRTIEEITMDQKRYILYNSRRLSGECLDICVTNAPTGSPIAEAQTVEPTASPTIAICEDKKEINVCVAIDNSGSICSEGSPRLCSNCNPNEPCEAEGFVAGGLCCGNYQHLTTFATNYINNLGAGTFSVVKFGTTASAVSPQGTAGDAKTAIATSAYTGGYTNTEDAIYQCKEQLTGQTNPVIVLVTDGTPTACRRKGGGYRTISNSNCSNSRCDDCINGAPQKAAEALANEAAQAGMSVVPVVIQSVSRNINQIEKFAKCPVGDSSCDVNAYKNLQVDDIDEIDSLLESLVLTTGCE